MCFCACEEERDCRAGDRLFGLRSPPPIGQCAACTCVCVQVCQWMCKSWSLCCSVQTLVRVRLKSWTSVWCSAHRACTKAQKQQSSGQQQRIRAAGASPRCMNPNPRHSQCAVRMSMSHFPSLCIFPANTIFVYFPQTQSLYIPRKHNLCIFSANTIFVYFLQTQFLYIPRKHNLCIFPANTIFVYSLQTQSLYIPRKHNSLEMQNTLRFECSMCLQKNLQT